MTAATGRLTAVGGWRHRVAALAAAAALAGFTLAAPEPARAEPVDPPRPQGVASPWTTAVSAGSPITRDEIIARAETWLHPPAPYSMNAYRGGYRTDCSGFVSMAWRTSGNFWTGDLHTIGTAIGYNDLRPGDMLLFHNPANPVNGSHVVLFHHWVGAVGGDFWIYEQTPPQTRHRLWSATSYNRSNFKPYRYIRAVDNGPARLADLDGDGHTDYAVWRPSNGTWYVQYAFHAGSAQVPWGLLGDVPVVGDRNGDRRDEYIVWRPSTGTWYNRETDPNGLQWGQPGDVPLMGDLDSNGRDEFMVWRPGNGTWYIMYDSGNIGTLSWGLPGDVPLVADLNGNGRVELLVWRPSNGIWYIRYDNGFTTSLGWGLPGDLPRVGDIDGDLNADLIVWRPSELNWYVRNTVTGAQTATPWGLTGDVPSVGDTNGDGRDDFIVWRPSNGTWWVRYANGGSFTDYQWGLPGDIPA